MMNRILLLVTILSVGFLSSLSGQCTNDATTMDGLCAGDTITVTLPAGCMGAPIAWTVTASSGSSATPSITGDTDLDSVEVVLGTIAGDIDVIHDVGGTAETTTFTVLALPIVSAGGPYTDQCSNGSALTLTGSPSTGGTGLWSGMHVSDGTAGDNIGSFDPNGVAVGSYNAVFSFTDANSCVDSATTMITVIEAPVISGDSETICAGLATSGFTPTSMPSGATITWTVSTSNIAGISDSPDSGIFSIPSITPVLTMPNMVGEITYTVTPTLNGCTGSTVDYVVNVNPVPVMTGINTTEICSGETHATFTLESIPSTTSFAWTADETNVNESAAAGTGNSIPGAEFNLTSNSSFGSAIYTVTPTLNGCVGETEDYVAIVNILPEFDVEELTVNCVGPMLTSVEVNASIDVGTLEYREVGIGTWQSSKTFSTLTSGGTYTFEVREMTSMCTISITEMVNCFCPTVSNNTIMGGESICDGDSPSQINGMSATASSGAFTYQWEISDTGADTWSEISLAVGQNITPTSPAVSSDYRRLVKIANCPDDISNVITITVNGTPSAPTAGPDVENCQGIIPNPAVTATAVGSAIDWYDSPTDGTLLFTGNSYVSSETATGEYHYYAEARNSNNCLSANRTVVKLTINASPSAPSTGAVVDNCEGITPNPAISATAPSGSVVDWYLNAIGGSPIATSSNMYISTETAVGSYSYFAESRNTTTSCVSSGRTEVTFVINETPVFTGLEVNCDGGALENVEVAFTIGTGTLEFRVDNGTWQPSNVFTGLNAGVHTFDARETSTLCIVSSNSQQINCACPSVVNNQIGEAQLVCGGETPATLVGGEATAEGENLTYQWQSKVAGSSSWVDVGSERDYSPSAITQTTDYRRLVIITSCPDDVSNEVKITLKPDPIVSNNIVTETICSQEFSSGFVLTSSPANATYSWTATASNVVGNSVSGNGNIPAEMFELSNSDNSGDVIYTVIPTLNNCIGPDQEFVVNVTTLPEFTISSSTGDVICPGEEATLSPNGLPAGNYNYQWTLPGGGIENSEDIDVTVSSSTQNTFTLKVTDNITNCSFSQTFVFTLSLFAPSLSLTPNTNSICDGDQISFSASGGNKFTWTGFNAPADVTTSFFSAIPPVGSNVFTVVIENSANCSQLFEETIVVNEKPTPNIITNTNGTEFCENEVITLKTEIPYIEYDWSNNSNEDSISFTANPSSTNFGVSVVDANGCENADEIDLIIHSAPTAEICNFIDGGGECLVLVVDSGLEVVFVASDVVADGACGAIKEYQWVFKKDGVIARTEPVDTDELKITFTTEDEGINSVELVIVDGCDCVSKPIVDTEFEVKNNEKCGASISTPSKACLETIYDLKAFPDSGTGIFNEPVEGWFIIETVLIQDGITPIGTVISPAVGRDFIIHSIEQVYESGSGKMFNDVLTVEYLEEGEYQVDYYYNFFPCIEENTKTVTVSPLPRFDNVLVDLEACDGEDFVEFVFTPDASDVNWKLDYKKAGADFTKIISNSEGNVLNIATTGNNDIDIVLQTVTDLDSGCTNDEFDQKEFTIDILDPVSATFTSECNSANDSIYYTIEISGGTGMFAIEGDLLGGSSFMTNGYTPEEPQVIFIEDVGCDLENITPLNNIVGACDFCLPLDTFITKILVGSETSIDICENETGQFNFDFSASVLSDKNGDGKVDFRDTLLSNQTILYVIKTTPSNEYEEENTLVKFKPVNEQNGEISSFDLVFTNALDSVLVAGVNYYLTAFVVPNASNIIAPEGECKGIKAVPLQFYVAPQSVIDLGLEEDNSICNQEIDYQIWRENSAQNDIWSSSDPDKVFIETDAANNRVLIAFGTGLTDEVEIYLDQINEYSTTNGVLSCSDSDSITLTVIDKIAPAEDSIIWFPGNFLTYTDKDKCYEWGYIDGNGAEVVTTESTRFYIYEGTSAFENNIYFVDVWECDTDALKECVTRVYYNASQPPVFNYKPDANYNVELFPNPHQGEFILRLDGEQAGVFQTKVFNSRGVLVQEHDFVKEYTEHEEIYSIENFPNGLYIIQVVDEGGLTNLIKMIKQQ